MDQTIDELEQMARNAQIDVNQRQDALEALTERAGQQEDLAPRVKALLGELLSRSAAETADEESFTASVIEAALDIEALELLPEIEKAFAEDRVDRQIVDLDLVYKELGLPAPAAPARRTDGLYLLLKCGVCQRVREHFSRFVLIDENTLREEIQSSHAAFMIDHEFVCPKCGAVEQYALSPIEWIRLMQMDDEQIVAMLQNRQPDKPLRPHPRVFYMRSQAFGRPMHPLDIVSEYRGRIALNPKNAELHSGLGDTLRYIGRYEQALDCYRKAVELAPLNTTFLFEAATAEHDFGDLQAARALYERCVSTGSIDSLGKVGEVVRACMQGLKALEKGAGSPWNYQLINASGVRLLPPPRPGAVGSDSKKDKRHKRH